jgi:hypothetical protein
MSHKNTQPKGSLIAVIVEHFLPRLLPFVGDYNFEIVSNGWPPSLVQDLVHKTPQDTCNVLSSGLAELFYHMVTFSADSKIPDVFNPFGA